MTTLSHIMFFVPHIDVPCPACGHQFRESTRRLRPRQVICCPLCKAEWCLDRRSGDPQVIALLARARAVRHLRRASSHARYAGLLG
jgi:hypothetical protein